MTELGPTNTWSPILTALERWERSWITQFSPMFIPLVPMSVAPYHTEEFKPKVTLPIIVELGAINYAAYKSGCAPPQLRFRRLGTIRSSDAFSPSILVPTAYRDFPNDLKTGATTFSLALVIVSNNSPLMSINNQQQPIRKQIKQKQVSHSIKMSHLAIQSQATTSFTSPTQCLIIFSIPFFRVALEEGHPAHEPSIHIFSTPVFQSKDIYLTSPPSSWTVGRTRDHRICLISLTVYESDYSNPSQFDLRYRKIYLGSLMISSPDSKWFQMTSKIKGFNSFHPNFQAFPTEIQLGPQNTRLTPSILNSLRARLDTLIAVSSFGISTDQLPPMTVFD